MSTIFLINLKQQQKLSDIWFFVTGRSNENICCNFLSQSQVEFKFDMSWDCLQLSFLIKSATRYMKFNGMRIKEILRRIWLLSANKIKPSELICKQSSQVRLELNLSFWQTVTAIYCRHGRASHSFGFQIQKLIHSCTQKHFAYPIFAWQGNMWMKNIRTSNIIFLLFQHISKSQQFFLIWIIIDLIYLIWETSLNKLKKHFATKNCSDLSLFE